jgi:hypothetical protein
MRFRNAYIVIGGLLVILLNIITDPDLGWVQNLPFGSSTFVYLLIIMRGILASAFLYITRKALMDYPEADFRKLGIEASKHPIGAAVYAMAISLMTVAVAIISSAVIIAS